MVRSSKFRINKSTLNVSKSISHRVVAGLLPRNPNLIFCPEVCWNQCSMHSDAIEKSINAGC